MKNKSSNTPMDKQFKILEKVRKVEVPPHLYSDIQYAIEKRQEETIPVKNLWMAAAGISILLMVNYTAITAHREASQPNLVEVFSLQPKNTITYEKE